MVFLSIISISVCSFAQSKPLVEEAFEKNQKQNLNTELEEQVIAGSGTIFIIDTSHTKFRTAYRDPSGLIWSNVSDLSGSIWYASDECAKLNAYLPTYSEFEQLRKYLGYGSKQGYSPYRADGKTEVIPHYYHNPALWTGDLEYGSKYGYSSFFTFNVSSGDFSSNRDDHKVNFLCVSHSYLSRQSLTQN